MVVRTSYRTVERNTINYMLKFVEEFELIKAKKHPNYKFARDFFKDKSICFQNFYKFYNRFIISGRNPEALLPTRRGPKPKYLSMPTADNTIESKVLDLRKAGHNKFVISATIKKDKSLKGACSASTVYRIFTRLGVEKLRQQPKEEKRKIMREYAGSLLHIDCHYLPKGIIKEDPLKRYYVLGAIDDYSRIVWVEVMASTKALDATFAMMDILLLMHQQYGIQCEEVLTDNGSEFCGGEKSKNDHPFERLLQHFAIKHRRTKPYRPQTNGKIERFWRSFDDEVIEGTEFQNLDELKDAVLGYNIYYNEHRPHQGIDGKLPKAMLEVVK